MIQKMINFDDVIKENIKEHNPNWAEIPDHPWSFIRYISKNFYFFKNF